ncbi:MAG: pyridoxine 5'-phosphate synthase [Thermodesulfobacteriota bacterium]
MPRLNVNIDHVATLRQARGGKEPDPVLAAYLAELAGAHGIVVHLRGDRRHIQERDLRILRQIVKTKLNLEMAPTGEMVGIASQVKPDMVTLVPENRQELTTEGGLDVAVNIKSASGTVTELKRAGIFVSLFVDPDPGQIEASKKTGAQMVEIHTGSYAEAASEPEREAEFKKIKKAIKKASELGMRVAAGHGLDYINVSHIAEIGEIEELNIGHSIVSRAVMVGFERAVGELLILIG